jgi:hypothetical protein
MIVSADIFLNIPINDSFHDWRVVTGYDTGISKTKEYEDFAGRAGAEAKYGKQLVGLSIIENCPVILVYGYLLDIFEKEHPFSMEKKHDGKPGRANPYIIAYCFSENAKDIPTIDQIKQQATVDVHRFTQEAYVIAEKNGMCQDDIPTQKRSFEITKEHCGAWKVASNKIFNGKEFTPFIDADGEIISLEKKKNPYGHCSSESYKKVKDSDKYSVQNADNHSSARTPAMAFSTSMAAIGLGAVTFCKNNPLIAILGVGTLGVGAALLWKLNQKEEQAKDKASSSSR